MLPKCNGGRTLAEPNWIIRGRRIDKNELEYIRKTISRHWDKGRTAISRILCEHWDWRQRNGFLKDRACRVLLLTLERKGLLSLPPPKNHGGGIPRRRIVCDIDIDTSPIEAPLSHFQRLTFTMVRFGAEEKLWDYLVHCYHYLGRSSIVGAYLKYLAYLDGRPVACLGWGSAAWKVACRDHFIGWDPPTREAHLDKVVNNTRFLILPWVHVPNLASRLLAKNTKLLVRDWSHYYRTSLALLETFVEKDRFQGTCYKAANWIHVGFTKGRGKYDQHTYSKPIKAVFVYPLRHNFREMLHG